MTMPIWPADLPQDLDRRNYRERLPDNLRRSSVDAGPEKRRQHTTSNVRFIDGQILMTGAEWKRLKYFVEVDLQSGVRAFVFPNPDRETEGEPATITVSLRQPPSRTNPGGDNYWVSLRLQVQPGG